MSTLTDQVVVVTGASGGLGEAVVETFLSRGANVIGVARELLPELDRREDCESAAADLSSREGAQRVVEEAMRRYDRIDCVAHLVGGFSMGPSVAETDEESLDQMITINLTTAWQMARAAIPEMVAAGRGRFIVVGSKAGVEPAARMGAYSVSKAALHAMVQALATEVAEHGVTANAVVPSIIDTPTNRGAMPTADPSRWVSPQAIADLIVWLASDAGRDINGALVPIYGRA